VSVQQNFEILEMLYSNLKIELREYLQTEHRLLLLCRATPFVIY